jgi:hypothetical protein
MKKITEYWSVILLCALALFIMYKSDKRVAQLERELKAVRDSLDLPSNSIDTLDIENK